MKKFKWTRWPKPKSRWRHSMPYVSPVRMWTSEVVFKGIEKDDNGDDREVYLIRGIDTRNQQRQKS